MVHVWKRRTSATHPPRWSPRQDDAKESGHQVACGLPQIPTDVFLWWGRTHAIIKYYKLIANYQDLPKQRWSSQTANLWTFVCRGNWPSPSIFRWSSFWMTPLGRANSHQPLKWSTDWAHGALNSALKRRGWTPRSLLIKRKCTQWHPIPWSDNMISQDPKIWCDMSCNIFAVIPRHTQQTSRITIHAIHSLSPSDLPWMLGPW